MPAIQTFMIADIRGFTRLTDELGDESAAALAASFAGLVRDVVATHGGEVVELRGDEVLAAFPSARQALRAGIALQEQVVLRGRIEAEQTFTVGVGLDAGEAVPVEEGYRGGALNTAARLCARAQPGEVLATETVTRLARRVPGLVYEDRGLAEFKGFSEPLRVVAVGLEGSSVPKRGVEQPSPLSRRSRATSPMPTGGFLGARPEGMIVAREEELQRLQIALESVASGSGRLVLLGGEPGVGKTRLAQELSLLALQNGFVLAPASCYEERQTTPFYPFRGALDAFWSAVPDDLRHEASSRWPYLRLILQMDSADMGMPAQGPDDQERLFQTVADFLKAMAERFPILLMIDDLQWADSSSLDLLAYLARTTRGSRVLLLGTYRDTEVDRQHPFHAIALQLRRQELAEWVAVRRLEASATAALVAATVGEGAVPVRFAQQIQDRTEGNPFFVLEVVRTLLERGTLRPHSRRWSFGNALEVPEAVRAVIEERLGRLAEPGQEILREASVQGQIFTFDILMATSKREEEEIERALDAATEARLVRHSGGDEYTFEHALTRETLYLELSPRHRRRLHLAAGMAIERIAPRRAGELAWHFLQAEDHERALRYALSAAEAAEAVFAHRDAEGHYRTALQVVWGSGDAAEAELLERLGRVLGLMGRHDEAIEALERSLQGWEGADDLEGQRRVVAQIGLLHAQRGTLEEGIMRLQPFLDDSAAPSPGLARLQIALAQLSMARREYAVALAAAERARAIGESLGDEALTAEADVHRGEALGRLGRNREARRAVEWIIARPGEGDLSTVNRALNGLGAVFLRGGEFHQSRAFRSRALQLAERLGDPTRIAVSALNLADVAFYLGDWEEARTLTAQAWDANDAGCSPRLAIDIHLSHGILDTAAGEWEAAKRHLQAAIAVARERGDAIGPLEAYTSLAEADVLNGRPQEARVRLEPLLGAGPDTTLESVDLTLAFSSALLDLGNAGGAEQLVVRAIADATRSHTRLGVLHGLMVQGVIRSREGRTMEATNLLEGALSLARRMPYPYGVGRILYYLAMVPASDRGQRERCLTEAREIFERLGAQPYLERVDRALAQVPETG